ncbi:MAG TPA: hypothetical protein VF138_06920 [Caulobacteraceae bacterium]
MISTIARLAASAAIALAVVGGAYAKPATKPMTSPVNEATRQEADKLIAATGAPELFLNETRDGAILIRHKASNFQCLFNPGSVNALLVTSGVPKGDEVGCDGPTTGLFQTTYFIRRAHDGDTAEKAFDEALAEVKGRWPDAMRIKVSRDGGQEILSKLAVEAPPSKTAWYLARTEDDWAFTRISTARVGDWMIIMRSAGPVSVQTQAESLSEMLWLTRLMVMTDPSLGPKPVVAEAGQNKR